MKFLAIVALAVVVEGITEYVKQAIPQIADKTWIILIITCAIGIIGALSFGTDLFELLQIQSRVPFVGEVMTGILCARGSNYIYDVIGKFTDAG